MRPGGITGADVVMGIFLTLLGFSSVLLSLGGMVHWMRGGC